MNERYQQNNHDAFSKSIQWSARLLVMVVWGSTLLFGLYIFLFYFLALLQGNAVQWNEILPGLYDANYGSATVGVGLHFAAGSVILILGCIQLLGGVRDKYPTIHRWLGRLYILAAFLTAIGGLVFIFTKGTIGGQIMDIGFTGYGILTLLAATATIYYARKQDFNKHRAWAIRLFALALGSWLYRMDYGFWYLLTDGLGHTKTFDGVFDQVMVFFFYVPNLLVAEIFIRRFEFGKSRLIKGFASFLMFSATAFLLVATYFFTRMVWGPAILGAFTN